MDVKTKLMIFIPSLTGGGSERVVSILCQHLDKSKFDIKLVLLKREGVFLKDIPSEVEIVGLSVQHARNALFKIIAVIQSQKPAVVFSTLGYLNIIVGIAKFFVSSKIKFIARESSIPSVRIKNERFPFLFELLYKLIYRRYDTIIAQSQYMKNDLIDCFSIPQHKIVVINNPVDVGKIGKMANKSSVETGFEKDKINLLAVGRLEKVKGYDLLLKAVSLLDDRFRLTILGNGREYENLNTLTERLQLQEKLRILPFQENPYVYMKETDFLVLSSRVEGFPNVAIEAGVCGIPVVAFDAPGGTGEIIKNGFNGVLAECCNVHVLKNIIEKAIYIKFDKQAIKMNSHDTYDAPKIVKQYENLLYIPQG